MTSSRTHHPDVSQINEYLYISSLPKTEHAQHIESLGIRLIISMPIYRAPKVFRKPPFEFVHCPSIDTPITPIPMFILHRGVTAALPVIERGEAVLVHCRSGVHRSIAMACCILIAKGYTIEEAMRVVKAQREVADPYIWYIRRRIEKFDRDWSNRSGQDP